MSRLIRGIAITLLINGALPYIVYVWLSGRMSGFTALSVATMIPLADNLLHLAKHKKLDAFGAMMMFTFLLGLALIMLGGDEKLLLIRESFVTAAVGLLFLASLLFPRPLIYYLAMRFSVKENAGERSDFAGNWEYPYFRYVVRLMTTVWGVILVAEAVVRTALVYELTTEQFLPVSNIVFYSFIGAAAAWTVMYRKRSRNRLLTIKNAAVHNGG